MKKVLVIDDDATVRRSLRRFLQGQAEVLVFESTQQLLDEVRESGSDEFLLLTDGNMKGSQGFDLDGDELIEAVRAMAGDRLVRAVIMSGNANEFRASANRLGVELLGKPVQPKILMEIVATFLGS
ncbi:MAG: response regulator [Candidatus Uhrbacteria bacterium]|nr:response regulator [Candidatus Uhrbacteria bacterium]